MSYKIVANSAGELICYGPNDGMYEPGIPHGCTLSIVDILPPLPPTPYQQLRAAAYPPIGNQLDALWHMIDNGEPLDKTSSFYTMIKMVKDTYPKTS